ncbi:hypothetical protein [Haloarchaeobius sp. TZWSO28]|uniref:hypothetical protein n=1 Tax=unclassified Haloarchaeobius TaxID=2614452 RepID=UPI003EBE3945
MYGSYVDWYEDDLNVVYVNGRACRVTGVDYEQEIIELEYGRCGYVGFDGTYYRV